MELREEVQLLAAYLNVAYFVGTPCREFWQEFESRAGFRANRLGNFSSDFLSSIPEHVRTTALLSLQDDLDEHAILFQIAGEAVILGPFVNDLREEYKGYDLHGQDLYEYRFYRSCCGVCNSQDILRAAWTLLSAHGLPAENYPLIRADDLSNLTGSASVESASGEFLQMESESSASRPAESLDTIVQIRYLNEEHFMDCITRGDSHEALISLKRMSEFSSATLQSSNWSAESARSIMRTLVRIAAARSGLSPLVIDTISQEYLQRQKIHPDGNAIGDWLVNMIRDLCREIRRKDLLSYSGPTQKVLFMVADHPEASHRISAYADAFHISESSLAHTLKKETGYSLTQIVQQERCRLSTRLLLSTDKKIQDIAAEVGYPDNNYFCKVFKKQYDMTPEEYRSKHRSV